MSHELLAYHDQRSANAEKAVEYLALANQTATRANAMVEAKAYFDDAMTLLETLADTPVTRRRQVSLLVDQIIMFQQLLRLPEYHALLTRSEPAAVEMGDPHLVEGLIESTPLGERPRKGLPTQRVYRVNGVRQGVVPFDIALRRGLAPLVGQNART